MVSSKTNVFYHWNSSDSKVQHARGLKHLGNDAKRGCVRVRRNVEERVSAVCVCVPGWLTSELRLSMLWRAGHPVELFSAMPEECKAATSPSLPSSR